MFVIRAAERGDLDGIHEVAKHLDTVNLPDDRKVLERILDTAERSFSGEREVWAREYVFVLIDTAEKNRIIGTSMIHAQHGTRRSPHVFFEVLQEERYSESIDRYLVHQTLQLKYNYNGPTEIGGLILLPEYRGRPESLGRLLSYLRFLYIAMHRDRFRDEVLSELLPPLEPDGTSILWECLGRHFTGLTYQEADLLSKDNKEFIRALFPQDTLYTSLFPKAVQDVIGQVGPETKGVERMLRKIGFTYADRIDPFDGGPHFTARTDEITLVKATRKLALVAGEPAVGGRPGIVAIERPRTPYFRAVQSPFAASATGLELPAATRELLGAEIGDELALLPL
jgi:arginine N-succinyltransferase